MNCGRGSTGYFIINLSTIGADSHGRLSVI